MIFIQDIGLRPWVGIGAARGIALQTQCIAARGMAHRVRTEIKRLRSKMNETNGSNGNNEINEQNEINVLISIIKHHFFAQVTRSTGLTKLTRLTGIAILA
jgi:hypothetical protein